MAAVAFLLAGLIPAGAMAWTANLGGQVRHTEIRPGAAAPGESPAAGPEVVEQSDDDRSG